MVASLTEILILLQLRFVVTGEKISVSIFYSDIKVEDSCSFTLFSELHARVSTGASDV